jgi:hypothetical protein
MPPCIHPPIPPSPHAFCVMVLSLEVEIFKKSFDNNG